MRALLLLSLLCVLFAACGDDDPGAPEPVMCARTLGPVEFNPGDDTVEYTVHVLYGGVVSTVTYLDAQGEQTITDPTLPFSHIVENFAGPATLSVLAPDTDGRVLMHMRISGGDVIRNFGTCITSNCEANCRD